MLIAALGALFVAIVAAGAASGPSGASGPTGGVPALRTPPATLFTPPNAVVEVPSTPSGTRRTAGPGRAG